MRFVKGFLKLIGILLLLLLINRWYLGGFSKCEVKEQNVPSYTIAYVNFVGNYGKVWPSMTKVYEVLSGVGIVAYTGVGIYYDDPAIVSWDQLRSDVGAIIPSQDKDKLHGNKEVKIMTVPQGNKMVVEFPLKNALSYMIGPMKVYPVMAKYMKEKGYTNEVPMTELYDMVAKKIYYIAGITVK